MAMNKIKNALYRFMYGRYGWDTLSRVLMWVYVAIVFVQIILSIIFRNNTLASNIISVTYLATSMGLVFWIFFRVFSRNIYKRRRENEKFCGFFKLIRNKFRDRKTHVYRKCPKCKAVLRLPKAKGKHTVVCPRCKNRFEVRG